MVIMRDTPPPLPADTLRELRGTLAASFGHKLVNHDGRLVLAIRVPGDEPHRERDLPLAADHIPEDEAALARDVLLIGAEKLIRLDPIPLRDLVRERLRDDTPVSKEVRRGLPREYGAALFNPATRRDWCIAVRVPRTSYRETTPEDLAQLQRAVEPMLAQPKAGQAAMCYLVADHDYRRMPLEEFVRTLRGEVPLKPPKVNNYAVAGEGKASRSLAAASSMSGSPFGMLMSSAAATDAKMEANKAKRAAAQGHAQAQAPALAAPPPPMAVQLNVPVPTSPFVAPSPVPATAVASVLGPMVPALQASPSPVPTVAAPPEPVALPPTDPLAALRSVLETQGFEVLEDVADLGLALAAHRPQGKRLVVHRVAAATPAEVQALVAKCAELQASAGVLVADEVGADAWLEAAGTPVTVLTPALAAALAV